MRRSPSWAPSGAAGRSGAGGRSFASVRRCRSYPARGESGRRGPGTGSRCGPPSRTAPPRRRRDRGRHPREQRILPGRSRGGAGPFGAVRGAGRPRSPPHPPSRPWTPCAAPRRRRRRPPRRCPPPQQPCGASGCGRCTGNRCPRRGCGAAARCGRREPPRRPWTSPVFGCCSGSPAARPRGSARRPW